jgi:WD40 repeat protein
MIFLHSLYARTKWHVYHSCLRINFARAYWSNTLLAILIGGTQRSSTKLHVTPDGKHLYFDNDLDVRVRDLASGESTLELHHSVNITDIMSVDWKTVVTISGDAVLRIWDRTRDVGRAPNTTDVKGLGHMVKYVSGHDVCIRSPMYKAPMYR